jgi:hypothetical protein
MTIAAYAVQTAASASRLNDAIVNVLGLASPLLGPVALVLAAVLGWFLKTWTDNRSWRRDQALKAYLAMLEATDHFSLECGRLWSSSLAKGSPEWTEKARAVQGDLSALDRAGGNLRLVVYSRSAELSLDLYITCEVMLRLAIAKTPTPAATYQVAAASMVHAYQALIEEGRQALGLRRWREFRQKEDWFFELSKKRFDELNRDYPLPM